MPREHMRVHQQCLQRLQNHSALNFYVASNSFCQGLNLLGMMGDMKADMLRLNLEVCAEVSVQDSPVQLLETAILSQWAIQEEVNVQIKLFSAVIGKCLTSRGLEPSALTYHFCIGMSRRPNCVPFFWVVFFTQHFLLLASLSRWVCWVFRLICSSVHPSGQTKVTIWSKLFLPLSSRSYIVCSCGGRPRRDFTQQRLAAARPFFGSTPKNVWRFRFEKRHVSYIETYKYLSFQAEGLIAQWSL